MNFILFLELWENPYCNLLLFFLKVKTKPAKYFSIQWFSYSQSVAVSFRSKHRHHITTSASSQNSNNKCTKQRTRIKNHKKIYEDENEHNFIWKHMDAIVRRQNISSNIKHMRLVCLLRFVSLFLLLLEFVYICVCCFCSRTCHTQEIIKEIPNLCEIHKQQNLFIYLSYWEK